MKSSISKIFFVMIVGILGSVFSGCGTFVPESTPSSQPETISETEGVSEGAMTDPESNSEWLPRNVLFTVNTQEFVFAEESAATLNRLIDLHEAYQVPVDIYLNDPILQVYLADFPDLIDRFKTSPMVSVSYHSRPPYPYYYDYAWMDWASMSDAEMAEWVEAYGTHAIDPTTGEVTEAPGGLAYFESVFGYPPPAGGITSDPAVGETLQAFFEEQGVTFLVEHREDLTWGTQKGMLWLRPEDVEVKLFERTEESVESIFSELDALEGEGPYFMNIKVHDNDFITDESAWISIYLRNKKQHKGTLTPPFDLSSAESRALFSDEESEPLWSAYEECLRHVSDHPELYATWNLQQLKARVGE